MTKTLADYYRETPEALVVDRSNPNFPPVTTFGDCRDNFCNLCKIMACFRGSDPNRNMFTSGGKSESSIKYFFCQGNRMELKTCPGSMTIQRVSHNSPGKNWQVTSSVACECPLTDTRARYYELTHELSPKCSSTDLAYVSIIRYYDALDIVDWRTGKPPLWKDPKDDKKKKTSNGGAKNTEGSHKRTRSNRPYREHGPMYIQLSCGAYFKVHIFKWKDPTNQSSSGQQEYWGIGPKMYDTFGLAFKPSTFGRVATGAELGRAMLANYGDARTVRTIRAARAQLGGNVENNVGGATGALSVSQLAFSDSTSTDATNISNESSQPETSSPGPSLPEAAFDDDYYAEFPICVSVKDPNFPLVGAYADSAEQFTSICKVMSCCRGKIGDPEKRITHYGQTNSNGGMEKLEHVYSCNGRVCTGKMVIQQIRLDSPGANWKVVQRSPCICPVAPCPIYIEEWGEEYPSYHEAFTMLVRRLILTSKAKIVHFTNVEPPHWINIRKDEMYDDSTSQNHPSNDTPQSEPQLQPPTKKQALNHKLHEYTYFQIPTGAYFRVAFNKKDKLVENEEQLFWATGPFDNPMGAAYKPPHLSGTLMAVVTSPGVPAETTGNTASGRVPITRPSRPRAERRERNRQDEANEKSKNNLGGNAGIGSTLQDGTINFFDPNDKDTTGRLSHFQKNISERSPYIRHTFESPAIDDTMVSEMTTCHEGKNEHRKESKTIAAQSTLSPRDRKSRTDGSEATTTFQQIVETFLSDRTLENWKRGRKERRKRLAQQLEEIDRM